CNQVHAKGVLKLRILIEVVEHDLGHFTALELNHQTHAFFVGLVANVGNAFYALLIDQFGDFFLEGLFIDLIRKRIHHNGLAVATVNVFKMGGGPHDHAATPGAIAFAHTGHAVNDAAGREIGSRNHFHELIDTAFRVAKHQHAAINNFRQVVRRNVRSHAHSNA